MTREEQLVFCKKCHHRRVNAELGFYCGLTDKIADFEEECSDFKVDKSSKFFLEESPDHEYVSTGLGRTKFLDNMRQYQNIYYAIAAGAFASLLCAILWAGITVATGMQIGFMALGVGLIVGYTVQYFGAGVDEIYGVVGAVFSLLGCVLGNLFSQVGFAANGATNYFEILNYWSIGDMFQILGETFGPVDLLFYAFAVVEGYKFGFLRYSNTELKALSDNEITETERNEGFRKYASIFFIVVVVGFMTKVVLVGEGDASYAYENGNVSAQGELEDGKEEGAWTFYHENGELMSQGSFHSGIRDGHWKWYDESGKLNSTGNYEDGIEEGEWINFYPNGYMLDSGRYKNGRLEGFWRMWYPSGLVSGEGPYKMSRQVGDWTYYSENGNIASAGKLEDGSPLGRWEYFHPNGEKAYIINYLSDEKFETLQCWDEKGSHILVDGNGVFKDYHENGQIDQEISVKDGKREGKYKRWYSNGQMKEEGHYSNGEYLIDQNWGISGEQNVTDGRGGYEVHFESSEQIAEEGLVLNGRREGTWHTYYESNGALSMTSTYVRGVLNGKMVQNSEDYYVIMEGNMKDGLTDGRWTWYHFEGVKSSQVNFKKGLKEGTQVFWDMTGNKVREEVYLAGILQD